MTKKFEGNQNKIAKNSAKATRRYLLRGNLLLTEKSTVPSGKADWEDMGVMSKKIAKIADKSKENAKKNMPSAENMSKRRSEVENNTGT